MLPAAREALHEGSEQALSGFSRDEVATLLGMLRRLNENLDRTVARETE
ncbi:hypothetical protein [Mesorhizobium carmichaelinearum]|nr:hypothetical protein [Mesorhizobium carmichaelinearum]